MTKLVFLVSGLVLIIFIFSAQARIINIPADYSSIQAGINASENGDTVLVQPGLYQERINYNGHHIMLGSTFLMTGDTAIIAETIIDGGAAGAVVTFANAENNATLIGFTVRNGRAAYGGGISSTGASPDIMNNIITANSLIGDGSWGGGIYCALNSSPNIVHNWIIGNRAGYGAGIATSNSSPIIEGNFISGNAATWSEVGGNGGGIYCNGGSTPIIRGNDIRSDSAYWGGGGIACLGNVQALIEDNTISMNFGGGVQLGMGSSILRNNVISGNSGTFSGGGINCNNFSGTISNNIITGNTAPNGAGIYCYSSIFYPSIANNVIYGNSNGIYLAHSTQVIVNSIFWENDGYEILTDSLSFPSFSYCDIQGGWPGVGNIDTDPLFRDTLNSDYHLQSTACGNLYDSPCIDAGHPNVIDDILDCSWGLGTTRSDIGAYGGVDSSEVGIGEFPSEIPKSHQLSQNYPNPFNAQTTIQYDLIKDSPVNIGIYDILGQRIATLVNANQPAGHHQIIWNAGDVSSGIYFYKINAGDYSETKKMVVMK